MKDADDILNEVLGVSEPTPKEVVVSKPIPKPSDDLDDVDADYKYQRDNFYNLIEKGQDAKDRDLTTGTDKTSTND